MKSEWEIFHFAHCVEEREFMQKYVKEHEFT